MQLPAKQRKMFMFCKINILVSPGKIVETQGFGQTSHNGSSARILMQIRSVK